MCESAPKKLTIYCRDRAWNTNSVLIVDHSCTLAALKEQLLLNHGYVAGRELCCRRGFKDDHYPITSEELFQAMKQNKDELEIAFYGSFFPIFVDDIPLPSADAVKQKLRDMPMKTKAGVLFMLACVIPVRFLWPLVLVYYLVRTYGASENAAAAPPVTPSSSSLMSEHRYAEQLKKLHALGFTQHTANIPLLETHNGDLNTVITELIQARKH